MPLRFQLLTNMLGWPLLWVSARAAVGHGTVLAPVPMELVPLPTCAPTPSSVGHLHGCVLPGAAICELPWGQLPTSVLRACHSMRETPQSFFP